MPSAFKVTRPSDIGASIAPTPLWITPRCSPTQPHNFELASRTTLAGDLHANRRIPPYRLHVGHKGRLLLLPQLASNPRKRFSQISFRALRISEGRIENGFHVGSRVLCRTKFFSRALLVNTQDLYHDEGYERPQAVSEVCNCSHTPDVKSLDVSPYSRQLSVSDSSFRSAYQRNLGHNATGSCTSPFVYAFAWTATQEVR